MQDEILKHTKKIYMTAKNSKYTFAEKLKEIIIEIFIIVFAITLSIWLHGWNEQRNQQKEVTEFLQDLKVDLKNDIVDLKIQNSNLGKISINSKLFKSLTREKVDSLSKNNTRVSLNLNPMSKVRNTGNYEGFRSSGNIGLIENRKLKSEILKYYQKTVPEKDDWQTYYNSLVFDLANEIDTTDYDTFLKSIYSSEKTKGFFSNIESQSTQIIYINKYVIKDANEMLIKIDEETKK